MSSHSDPVVEDAWRLTYPGYDPGQEPLREALCTLGNGVFATRGAAPECTADRFHYPGTYVVGVYDRAVSRIAGREVENEDLVNAPNWLPLTFRIDEGPWFGSEAGHLLAYRQVLDLRHGLLERWLRVADAAGRETSVTQRRLVHMATPHLAALETTLRAENWSGQLTVRSLLDGGVQNQGVDRYRDLAGRHLTTLGRARAGEDIVLLRSRTLQSRVELAEASRTRVYVDDTPPAIERRYVEEGNDAVGLELALTMARGTSVRVEKVVSLFTSRGAAISEPGAAAVAQVRVAGTIGELVAQHVRAWESLWERFGVALHGSSRRAQALHLHVFHLLQTLAPHVTDLDVGVPARGLHGEAYRGHVFWDELFVLPMLTYRMPEVTRSMLRYRHRRLPAARRAARDTGHTGAMFPWQSGSDGREESQRLHLNPRSGRWMPDESFRQRHVGLAIAFNVWHYVQVTGDVEFLARHGAELMLEIARFFAGLATYDPLADRYDIAGVMGPDEFHDADPNRDEAGLLNNAYTNILVAWLMATVPKLLDLLPGLERRQILDRLGLAPQELAGWETVSRRLAVPFHDDGVISQFEGYRRLLELDWEGYRRRYGDISRLDRILEAEGDSVNRYRASKQADVLMLCYLFSYDQLRDLLARLGYPFTAASLRRTVAYYRGRTSHGSTLSQLVHSWVLARTDRRTSLTLFDRALASDIDDVQGGTTAEGIHLGAMTGTVDLLLRGYSGLEVADGVLRFKPSLPAGIKRVEFRILYRQRWITVALSGDDLELVSEATPRDPVPVEFRGERRELASAGRLTFRRPTHQPRGLPHSGSGS